MACWPKPAWTAMGKARLARASGRPPQTAAAPAANRHGRRILNGEQTRRRPCSEVRHLMEQQVLADHLSGFLAAEQGAWQYCQVAKLRANGQAKLFEQWAQQIAQHCQQLVTLIQSTGGDPNYVSPTACVA